MLLTGQGIHPPLSRLAFSDCLVRFRCGGDVTDIGEIFDGCSTMGAWIGDICADGGRVTDGVDWEDICEMVVGSIMRWSGYDIIVAVSQIGYLIIKSE